MSLDEETLETAANGGMMDLEKWPGMVEPLLDRLEHIVYNVFPMPKMPPDTANYQQQQQQTFSDPSASSFLQEPNSVPSSSNKENDSPADLQTPTAPSSMPPPPSSSFDRIPDSQPQSSADPTANGTASLPAPLVLLLDSIRSTLRTLFSSQPPHTIQRLAELIIRPTSHYRTLPAYLRAVDRVVSVTSSADIFPLQAHQSGAPNGVLNGAENSFILPDHGMGDESLGGALLTPIPWLNNVASPEAGSGVVVGEGLETMATQTIPQEMEGAATVSTAQQPSAVETQAMEGAGSPPGDVSEDTPHARGPQIIGVEDMGLQDGRGVEMTLSNPDDASDPSATGADSATQQAAEGKADGDGDIKLDDAKAANGETSESK